MPYNPIVYSVSYFDEHDGWEYHAYFASSKQKAKDWANFNLKGDNVTKVVIKKIKPDTEEYYVKNKLKVYEIEVDENLVVLAHLIYRTKRGLKRIRWVRMWGEYHLIVTLVSTSFNKASLKAIEIAKDYKEKGWRKD